MRIAFLGNFRPEFSSENDWLKTLKILGHEVHPLQEDKVEVGGGLLEETIEDSDVFWWTHTNNWPLMGRTREWVEALPIPSLMVTLDLYRGLEREADIELPHFSCRHVFTPDDPDWLRSRGVNAYWSPPGVLGTSCYVAAPDPLHESFEKIVFVGSRKYHAAWPWRAQLIEYLEETYGDDFVLFDHSSGARGHALNVLYASAAVVVGDSCFASPDSAYTSDRLFESLGRGANLVYPDIAWKPYGSLRGFVHTYAPGDFQSLDDAIADALACTDNRVARLEQAAYVAKFHTYERRLQAILAQATEVK